MKNKLNQFIDNTNGQFIEVSDRKNIYMCMDLAYLWVFCLGFPKATIQHLYASQVFTNPNDLTRQYFDIIPNTPDGIPQDGDLVVLKGGEAGHIVIALSGGTTNSFMCFEQNSPLGTNAHIQSRNYTNVLGWLRPKGEIISDIYKGIDLTNKESVKVCVDTWKDIVDGKYIKKEDCDKIKKEDCDKKLEALSQKKEEVEKEEVEKLKEQFIKDKAKEVKNALQKAKEDWKVVELQNEVKECEEVRKTTAYKVTEIITKVLQALKIIKKEK